MIGMWLLILLGIIFTVGWFGAMPCGIYCHRQPFCFHPLTEKCKQKEEEQTGLTAQELDDMIWEACGQPENKGKRIPNG